MTKYLLDTKIMSNTTEEKYIKEKIKIVDNKGLEYSLNATHYFDNDGQSLSSVNIYLVREKRNVRVGEAYLTFLSPTDVVIGDLHISNEVPASNLNDKIHMFSHWGEPTNYQRRNLGTKILKYIIKLAKSKNVKMLHGSLVKKDIRNNPSLVNWYKKHGFEIEPPPIEKSSDVVHRICLYLN